MSEVVEPTPAWRLREASNVASKLSDAIQAVKKWREAQEVFLRESIAAEEMFIACYPELKSLIEDIGAKA